MKNVKSHGFDRRLRLACLMFVSIALSSCANLEKISGDLGITDSTRGYPKVSNTILQACAAGFTGGIAKTIYEDIFQRKKRRTEDYLEDAAVGTAVGCTAGAVLNYKRTQYKKKADYYTAEIETTKSLNKQLESVNSHLFARTAANKQQLNVLREQKKASQLDAKAARAARNTAKADLAWAKKQLKNAEDSLSTQKSALAEVGSDISASDKNSLRNEVSQLEKYVNALEKEVGYMSNINDSLVNV